MKKNLSSNNNDLPSISIRVSREGRSISRGDIEMLINRDFKCNPDILSLYCFNELNGIHHDLILICGSVYFADRRLTRKSASNWARNIHLDIPVENPEFWRQQEVYDDLCDLLGLLSGDNWSFSFYKREWLFQISSQRPLALKHDAFAVVPFSDGLDSFAVSRLLTKQKPLLLITTGRKIDVDREWRFDNLDGQRRRVSLPFVWSENHHKNKMRENSGRTRAFVYYTMAGLAADLSGTDLIIIPENGQGSIEPWLNRVGIEPPDMRANPIFTRRLSLFLNRVLGSDIHFEHPALFFTKGSILRQLAEAGLESGWERTISCPRGYRQGRAHCGVCSACLLRRQALQYSGLGEDAEGYVWQDLSAASLDQALTTLNRNVTETDRRYAGFGVLSMDALAELSEPERFQRTAAMHIPELAEALDRPLANVTANLQALLAAHRQEWESFVDGLGPKSFVAEWIKARRC